MNRRPSVVSAGSRRTAAPMAELQDSATQAARLLRVLANQNRLMLLCMLVEGEKTVGELNESLPLSQSALSQHLAMLRAEGMVRTRRAGASIYYGLESPAARQVIETLHGIYCQQRC